MVAFFLFDNLSCISLLSSLPRHTCEFDLVSKKKWWLHCQCTTIICIYIYISQRYGHKQKCMFLK